MIESTYTEELIKEHCLNSEPDDIIKGAVEGHVRLFTLDKLQHVDVNECKCPGGYKLIHLAVHYGQLEVVKLLIAAGADVDLEVPETIPTKHPVTGRTLTRKTRVDVLLEDDLKPPSSIYSFMNAFPFGSVRHCAVHEMPAGFMMSLYWWSGCYKGMEITVDIILALPVQHSPTNLTRRISSKDSMRPFCYLVPKTQDLTLKKYLWRYSTSNIEKEEMLAATEEAKQSYIKAKVLLTQACSPAANLNLNTGLTPVPSFFLKTAFFFELEQFPENTEWEGLKHLDRMESIFKRLDKWLLEEGPIPSFFIEGVFIKMKYSLELNPHVVHNVSNIVQFLKKHKSEGIDFCPRQLCHALAYLGPNN